jgi:hypothetical protein
MASLVVPSTPVSRRALEATPSKKVSQRRLACVCFTSFYLQGRGRFSGHILGLSHKTHPKISSN